MQLILYSSNGVEKARFSPSDSSTQTKEIQGDNVLGLSFTLYEFVPIDVNDYIDYEGERYRALEKYAPSEKSTVEWEYSVQFYGVESLIKRFLVLNNTDGDNEAVFTLTDKPRAHVSLIVACINAGMGTSDWKVGAVDGAENVVIDYHGKYCDEALKELAEAVGVEWWIEGTTVNLTRCCHGTELTIGYGNGNGLVSLSKDAAENAKFYTRLFPIGSSRNISCSYFWRLMPELWSMAHCRIFRFFSQFMELRESVQVPFRKLSAACRRVLFRSFCTVVGLMLCSLAIALMDWPS